LGVPVAVQDLGGLGGGVEAQPGEAGAADGLGGRRGVVLVGRAVEARGGVLAADEVVGGPADHGVVLLQVGLVAGVPVVVPRDPGAVPGLVDLVPVVPGGDAVAVVGHEPVARRRRRLEGVRVRGLLLEAVVELGPLPRPGLEADEVQGVVEVRAVPDPVDALRALGGDAGDDGAAPGIVVGNRGDQGAAG
jgi:hypothetical protein